MPFIKLFVVFVTSGLSIQILLIIRVFVPYFWYLWFLSFIYLNFPLRLSNVIIPPSLFMSAVGRASVYLNLNFPLRLSNVIIPPSLLMSAVARASLSCRSSVAHPSSVAESLPRAAYYFLFSFFSSLIMSENHLDACRLVDAYFRLNLAW